MSAALSNLFARIHTICLSCGERAMRKDDRVLAPDFKVRCRRCGKGYAYYVLADNAPSLSGNWRPHPTPPLPIENDLDWSSITA